MLFDSLPFIPFFIVAVVGYYALPYRYRVPFLLVASCYFYMSYVPAYILILFALITLDFFLAPLIARSSGHDRKLFLTFSIIGNLGMLGFFKYFNFFNANIAALAHVLDWNYASWILAVALPLGLSFHVFQSLSYVIEVYRGKYEPEHNYLTYALYVMFFPQLVAGPIERPQQLLPQFHVSHDFDAAKVRRGLERMLWGFFKKLVIADNLALLVNTVYANLSSQHPTAVALAAVLFTYQLYADFSGYSDIAVGAALVLGYELVENFDRPFASRSIPEFWRRWHISLSSWLRDYLYYPLVFSGKRVSEMRILASLFITFTLIGLWHGAAWTYVAFGALHGIYLVVSQLTKDVRPRIAAALGLDRLPRFHAALQVLMTFALVVASLILFRSTSVGQAAYVFSRFALVPHDLVSFLANARALFTPAGIGIGLVSMTTVLGAIVVVEGVHYLQARLGTRYVLERAPAYARIGACYAMIVIILTLGHLGGQSFIYFQF